MGDNIEMQHRQAGSEDVTDWDSCTVTGLGIETFSYVVAEFATEVAQL
jgi:hypothetical protein